MENPGQNDRSSRPDRPQVERRSAPRFEPVEERIWIGWWDGEQFRTVASRLLNVSRSGAAIASTERPRLDEIVWFCVVGARWSGSVRAKVVGIGPPRDNAQPGHCVRLSFVTPCHDALFQAALGQLAPSRSVSQTG